MVITAKPQGDWNTVSILFQNDPFQYALAI